MPFHKVNIWAENAETVSYVTLIIEPPTATQMMAYYNQLKRHGKRWENTPSILVKIQLHSINNDKNVFLLL